MEKEKKCRFLSTLCREDILQVIARWVVGNIESILILVTPILSPIPSAFAVIRALTGGGWNYSVPIGIIVECMGLASGAFMGSIHGYNRRHPEKRISPKVGYGLFGFYLILVVLIVFGYETLPSILAWLTKDGSASDVIRSFVPILFPGLTLVGSVIVGVRDFMNKTDADAKTEKEKEDVRDDAEFSIEIEMKRRKAEQDLELSRLAAQQKMDIDKMKAESKIQKDSVAGSVARTVAESDSRKDGTPMQQSATPDRCNSLLEILQQSGDIGPTAFAKKLGVDRATIYRDLKSLESRDLVHQNGKGWTPGPAKG